MRCNKCWQEVEGSFFATICGHLFCTDDADKILSSGGACPVCDQILSKSLMKPVDSNPEDESLNMALVGFSPLALMTTMYRSVVFYIGQKELQVKFMIEKMVSHYREKCEMLQEKFTEKLEQWHTAYQKMAERCQMMQQEIETLTKDNKLLRENLDEETREKRKLDEMYDQLMNDYRALKRRGLVQPASNFYSRNESDLFSNQASVPRACNIMDERETGRKGNRRVGHQSMSPRNVIRSSPIKRPWTDLDLFSNPCNIMDERETGRNGNRRVGGHPSMSNLIRSSPIKRPRSDLFSSPFNIMDERKAGRKGQPVFTLDTPELDTKQKVIEGDYGNRRFGTPTALKNLVRSRLSRNSSQFTM